MELKLIKKREEIGDVISFIWESKERITWKPGQFFHYTLFHDKPDDRGEKRYFTISSAPFEGFIMNSTRIIENRSTFKNALYNLPLNGRIEATGPKGDFVLEDFSKYYVLIAGGIGITPYRSMLVQFNHDQNPLKGVLIYQNKDQNFVFREEMERFAKEAPDFHLEFLTEAVTPDFILEEIPSGHKPFFYLSGPESMVETYEKMLTNMGFAEEQIKGDFFPGYEWPLK